MHPPPLEKGPEEQPPGDSPSRRSPSLSPFPFFVQSESVSLSDFSLPIPIVLFLGQGDPCSKNPLVLSPPLLPSFRAKLQCLYKCAKKRKKTTRRAGEARPAGRGGGCGRGVGGMSVGTRGARGVSPALAYFPVRVSMPAGLSRSALRTNKERHPIRPPPRLPSHPSPSAPPLKKEQKIYNSSPSLHEHFQTPLCINPFDHTSGGH